LSISERAWKVAQEVKYVGYDAILPFQTALERKEFPYTPSWRSLAALDAALDLIDKESLQGVFDRHLQAQQYTIKRLTEMGIRLYLKPSCLPLNSPTVTAAYVPDGWTWEEFDTAMRDEGVRIGGTFGRVAGKIFRIGHMGSQADLKLLEKAFNIMETVLKSKKVSQ
jgi:aspartate aminotransferase-like enzyme